MLLVGCASAPNPSADPLSPAPEDFTLDITVLRGRAADALAAAHLRPGKYVLFSDGSLHFGSQPDRGADWLPDPVRTLDRRQVAGIWSLARQLGFIASSETSAPINLTLIEPPRNGLAYLVAVAGSGQRWTIVRRSAASEPPDPACAALVRHLAELAWVTDVPANQPWVMPVRYDFGPDPYARYRTHADTP